MKSSIAELSVDTQVLIKKLETVEIDQTISYETLGAAIHRNVQGEARHLLDTARNHMRREHGRLFDCVIGVGLKRLNDTDAVGIGDRYIKKIRKASRTTAKKLSCIDSAKLTDTDRNRLFTNISVAGGVALLCRPKSIKQIESSCADSSNQLPSAATLALFGK